MIIFLSKDFSFYLIFYFSLLFRNYPTIYFKAYLFLLISLMVMDLRVSIDFL